MIIQFHESKISNCKQHQKRLCLGCLQYYLAWCWKRLHRICITEIMYTSVGTKMTIFSNVFGFTSGQRIPVRRWDGSGNVYRIGSTAGNILLWNIHRILGHRDQPKAIIQQPTQNQKYHPQLLHQPAKTGSGEDLTYIGRLDKEIGNRLARAHRAFSRLYKSACLTKDKKSSIQIHHVSNPPIC